MMLHRLALAALLASVLAACGSAAPSPSPAAPSAVATTVPTASPAPATSHSAAANGDPFADQPYSIDLADGWEAYDLSTLSGPALEAFTQANPGLAAAIQAFQTMPNVRLAVNKLQGNALVAIAIPSQGLTLDMLGQTISAQFQAVPGVAKVPAAETETLPAGPALHWPLSVTTNKAGGGTLQVDESIHLLANDKTALLVEFVTTNGAANPDESSMIQTVRFKS
jgi:phage tail protein X